MASQHPNNAGQQQMMRDNMLNQPSDIHSQGQNQSFLEETGTHIGGMAHGVTEIGKGAALGTASLARGAFQGVSSVAQGTADAIKNTFSGGPAATTNHPTAGATDPNSHNISMDGSNYPNRPSYPHAP